MQPIKTKRGRLLSPAMVRETGGRIRMHNKRHTAANREMVALEKKRRFQTKKRSREKQNTLTRMETILGSLEKYSLSGKKMDAKRQDFLLRQLTVLGKKIIKMKGLTLPKRFRIIEIVVKKRSLIGEIKELETRGLLRAGFTADAKIALSLKQNAK